MHPPRSSVRSGRAAVAVVALAASAFLAGCSGEDDSEPEARLSTVRSGLAAMFAGDHAVERDITAGNCFAEALTDEVDLADLREAGVLDSSYAVVAELPALTEELAVPWARAQLACTDFAEESARAQVAASKGAADAEAYAGCLRAALSDSDLEAALVETLTGTWDGPALTRLAAAQTSCAVDPR
ncbi:hypothetical protein [Nocardioides ferulae]|uniref:hypothetical protein n=1 Tax=Nocardioides ferulae TaxID=2340821 RepID=UPI000F894C22|nr:hypothetical protein [Nocardioides ferulae]